MRLVQASLAAVGAFWSELIPAPSLWDYEGAALADREAAVEVWEPSHADYTDEPLSPLGCDSVSTSRGGGRCKCGHWLHFGNLCAACGCTDCTLPAAVPADEPPGGIEVPALPPGLPFTFNADELVETARELILDHYQFADVERVGELHLAHGAAELVVSQLVADLTAAYTEAQK